MKRGTIFAGLIGFSAGYLVGKADAKKEETKQTEAVKPSLMDELVDEVKREQDKMEEQEKPIIHKKDRSTSKMLKKRKR